MTLIENVRLDCGDYIEVTADVEVTPIRPATHRDPPEGGATVSALYIEGSRVDEAKFPELVRIMATLAAEAYYTQDTDADYYYDREREAV